MLLTVASKVLSNKILKRIKYALEGRLRDKKAGFC